MPVRAVLYVLRNPLGWWEVRDQNGEAIGRYASEFQAWNAGRSAAEARQGDLVVNLIEGPARREAYDPRTGRMTPVKDTPVTAVDTPSAAERRQLILLVEDMVDARELYADYLTYAGFSVVTAINGHEALGLAKLLRPDLILMDIRLPGMDGLEATADLKANPDLSHIPVVAITADSSAEIGENARRAGCSAVIMKPVLPDEVARRITDLLATHSQRSGC